MRHDKATMTTTTTTTTSEEAGKAKNHPSASLVPAAGDLQADDSGGDGESRGHWSKGIEFFLSCVGYAVGVGNIWRFPYMCIKNGGGAFLIPFFLFLFICGMPLFLLELVLGQFSNLSPITLWNICPLFKGIGLGMVIVSGIVCIYFNVIMAWSLFYLCMSVFPKLPWSDCDNAWNTAKCSNKLSVTHFNQTLMWDNMTTLPPTMRPASDGPINATYSPSEEFWRNYILGQTSSPDDVGQINWPLLACLAVAWVAVFLCMFKGVQTSGKVVYVTAVAPYIFLAILLVRGVTLPGAADGLIFYLKPDFAQLLNYHVWIDACLQIFFSLGPAWGGLITMASFNKFNYNCYRDAFWVSFIDAGTCFVGGLVIFSVLGNMAYQTGTNIQDYNRAGPGLAFVVYPAALTHLPLPQLWAILFFAMLLTLGIDSQFGMFETVVSGVLDHFKGLRKHKTVVIALLAFGEFLLGVPFVTGAGYYYFQLINHYAAALSVTLMALLETLVVSYIYGINRLYEDMELMFQNKAPHRILKVFWMFITPFLLFIIVIGGLTQLDEPIYSELVTEYTTSANGTKGYPLYVQRDFSFPRWQIGLGWICALSSLVVIPMVMVFGILKTKGSFTQRIKKLCRPTAKWVPSLDSLRPAYLAKYADNSEPVPVRKSSGTIVNNAGNNNRPEGEFLLTYRGPPATTVTELPSPPNYTLTATSPKNSFAPSSPAAANNTNSQAPVNSSSNNQSQFSRDENDSPYSTIFV